MSKERRLELQAILINLLGSKNVYFQPPSSVKMQYPAIIYERGTIETLFANNRLYQNVDRYTVTIIDANPDSDIPDKVLRLPLCRFDRHYTAENLNHDVFNVYY